MNTRVDSETVRPSDPDIQALKDLDYLGHESLLRWISHGEQKAGLFVTGALRRFLHIEIETVMQFCLLIEP